MLIEVLISVLIFSVGVVALVALQAAMTRAQTEAKARTDASYLATELVGLMWSDVNNLSAYTTANCASNTQCNMWLAKVQQTLPTNNTAPVVTVDTGASSATLGDVSITITWQSPGGDTHRYVMSTSIKS
ncbi:hypothetical protein AQB9606_00032 [Aquabacterium sp. CECT 9606]|nr:hypothetical protein AQB9606_00032 [Aquabacterium sp. CECT 9606]